MLTKEERDRWASEAEYYKTLGYWPDNGATFPTSPQGGMWHDCSWVDKLAKALAHIREQDVAIAYLQRQILCYGEHEGKLEAALAEAREMIQAYFEICNKENEAEARAWLAAHPAPKETPDESK